MDSPFLVPLAAFALTVLIVAIVQVGKIHECETEVTQRAHGEELEHRRKMEELDRELKRVKQSGT